MVNLHLTAEDYARLASLGVFEKDGKLTSQSGREVSAGTAAALLSKHAGQGYPDVNVTFAPMPPPEAFDRGRLVAGHAARSADDYTTGVPAHGAVGVIAERERERAEREPTVFREAFKGKKAKRARRAREAEAGAVDEPRTHVETVKAATVPDPDEFQRGYLAAGHQWQSPAVTGRRGTTGLPPSNDGVAEPGRFDRGWLTSNHQSASPGDEGDNSPVQPGQPAFDLYDEAAAAFNANQSAVATHHVEQTARVVSEPAPAQWSPSPGLGAASMPHPTNTSALPVGRAPGE